MSGSSKQRSKAIERAIEAAQVTNQGYPARWDVNVSSLDLCTVDGAGRYVRPVTATVRDRATGMIPSFAIEY